MSLITDEPTERSQPARRSLPGPPFFGKAQMWMLRAEEPIAHSVPYAVITAPSGDHDGLP